MGDRASIRPTDLMKLKTILSIVLGVGLLSPTLAFCAEGGAAESGSWVALIFYIINFAIFVYILMRFAGPLAVKFFHDRATEIREGIDLSESGFRSASQTAEQAEAELRGLAAEKDRLLEEMRAETAREVGPDPGTGADGSHADPARRRDDRPFHRRQRPPHRSGPSRRHRGADGPSTHRTRLRPPPTKAGWCANFSTPCARRPGRDQFQGRQALRAGAARAGG